MSRRLLCVAVSAVLAAAELVAVSVPSAAELPTSPASAVTDQEAERPDLLSAQSAARRSGRPVEVTGLRDETSRTFANPDGTLTAVVGAGPLNVSRDGEWVPVDVTLVREDGVVRPRAGWADVAFSGGGSGTPAVALRRDGGRLELRWPAALPAPDLDGTTATYRDVVPGADLVLQATRTGFEQSVVLRSRPAVPPVFRLPIGLAGGWSLARPLGGGLRLTDAAGRVIAQGQPPVMYGAARDPVTGEPTRSAPLTVTVVGGEMQIAPDPAFLDDPAVTYPLTLDPDLNFSATNDTYVQQGYGADGVNYDSAGELRTGYQGVAKARSLLKFPTTGLSGKQLVSATLTLYNFASSTCVAKRVYLHKVTQSWSAGGVTWNNQPTVAVASTYSDFAKGSTGCPEGTVTFGGSNLTALVGEWVANPSANYGMELRGVESDALSFQKFTSANHATSPPRLTVTYNSYPDVPPLHSPASGGLVTQSKPTLQAVFRDAEAGAGFVGYTVYQSDGVTPVAGAAGNGPTVPSGSVSAWTSPVALADGAYTWKARANDGLSAGAYTPPYSFTVDTTAPAAPAVTSSTFGSSGGWNGAHGQPGSFTFTSTSTDVKDYLWGIDQNPPPTVAAGSSPTISPVVTGGPHTLYVRTRDRANNVSAVTSFVFNVAPGAITSVAEGDRTTRYVPIAVKASPAYVKAVLRFRESASDPWITVDRFSIVDGNGQPAPADGLLLTGGVSAAWTFDAAAYKSNGLGDIVDGPFQLDVQLHNAAGPHADSYDVSMTVDKAGLSADHATAGVGPGSVDLVTGNYTIGTADVSIDSFGSDLTVSRTFTSRDLPSTDGPFGRPWKAGFPVDAAGADYARLVENAALTVATVTLSDGSTVGFAKNAAGAYVPEIGAEDLALTKTGSVFTLTDIDGNKTTFDTPSAGVYRVAAVSQPGSTTTTTYSYDASGRVVRVLAPVPAGVTCAAHPNALAAGCRALTVTYATATTPGLSGSAWGDVAGRVKEIGFTAYDPDTGTVVTRGVAGYRYDNYGALRGVFDPRLRPNPSALDHYAVTYTYGSSYLLASVRPAGEEAWTFGYTSLLGDCCSGQRLRTASRPSLVSASPTATTTVVYQVPVSGAGAPYDLSSTSIARWAQSVAPTAATAIFPPTQVPADPPADYTKATVHYADSRGRRTNTAAPGGHVTTSEPDRYGNVLRELTAANRARALDTGATAVEEAALAGPLYTERTYSADGLDLLTETGPRHEVVLPGVDGLVPVRARTVHTYDEGSPDPSKAYHLVTTTRTHALRDDGSVADERTVGTGYDWVLLKPTSTTVDPGGLGITSTTVYNATTGLPTSSRMPSETAAAAVHTLFTVYYSAAQNPTDPECGGKPYWANLACKTHPQAQPGTTTPATPSLPVTTYTYSWLDQVKTTTETASLSGTSSTRTTTIGYDAAGRPVTETIAGGVGTALPVTTTVYDPVSGRAIRTEATIDGVARTLVRGFDTLGRMTTYEDADDKIASTSSFDVAGRPLASNDGKQSVDRTYGYDELAEPRGLLTSLTDPATGTFSAAYDADGRLVRQTYPNGLRAETGYDAVGTATRLSYVDTACTPACAPVLEFAVRENVHGQQVSATGGPDGTQTYRYDPAGRLVGVDDAAVGAGSCTTRSYTLDRAGNRTGLATQTWPGTTTCGALTATPVTSAFDSADRLLATGYGYDMFGRTTTVAAADAGGTALTAGYYANDLVRSLAGTTYHLDPARRRRAVVSGSVTKVDHFADDGDSPAWTDEGAGAWTRNIEGITGDLVAVESSTAGTTLQITNLHGDVVATALATAGSTGLTATFGSTEFGQPRDPAANRRYAWLGGKQRAADTPAGIVLMGVRLYNPRTGRFLQTDPVRGGSHNAYDYSGHDPINMYDLDGRMASANEGGGCPTGGCHFADDSPPKKRKKCGFRCRIAHGISKYKWDIALAVVTVALPGAGVAVWSIRATKGAIYANRALRGAKIGGYGARLLGREGFRVALHAPHNLAKRHAARAAAHAGRWHWHTGPNRTPRAILRFWRHL